VSQLLDVLHTHLPGWRENRSTWPLWTYNRAIYSSTTSFGAGGELLGHRETPLSWQLCPHWIERIRWSPLLPYASLVHGFESAAGQSGFHLTRCPEPDETEVPGMVPGRPVPQLALISLGFRLRAHAIFASLAPEIPERLVEFTPPSDYCRKGWLDAMDRTQLTERVEGLVRLPANQ
jgi:hypothetical protein